MKIAYIGAGAARMYCGSCLHANSLAAALIARGHDVTLVPTYTPLKTDEQDVSLDRVFLSGINLYLQHRWPFLRRMPAPLHSLLESPVLLRLAGRMGSVTDSSGLGPLTLSLLEGENGPQAGELVELADYLQAHVRPDIVHLPNSMMIALAAPIRRRLGVPVLCGLQGEDLFIRGLPDKFRERVCRAIHERAGEVDGFVATSRYGADSMAELLSLDRSRIHVVPLGLNLEGYGERPPRSDPIPAVGYMARICPEKGFGLAVDAFLEVSRQLGPGQLRLVAAGYLDRRDRGFLDEMQVRIREAGLASFFEYRGEVSRQGKIDLFHAVDFLSVPSPYHEPKGLYVLEALASGIPVVQPRHGAFEELIEQTGGGILVEPDSPTAFAAEWRRLLENPLEREELGRRGREAVHRHFSDTAMADATASLYRRFIDRADGNDA